MKMIKLSEDHYIVVDDSQIVVGDWCYRDTEVVFQATKELLDYYNSINSKHKVYKITHSTQPLEDVGLNTSMGWQLGFDKIEPLYLSEVKSLIGEVDVEKMAEEALISHPDFKAEGYSDYQNGRFNGIVEGYNQALEDNKDRKYTREDLLDAYTWGFLEGTERGDDVTDSVYKFSQSLQPKTEWDVEFVDGKLKLK